MVSKNIRRSFKLRNLVDLLKILQKKCETFRFRIKISGLYWIRTSDPLLVRQCPIFIIYFQLLFKIFKINYIYK
jgi:hypothetical protein